MLTSLFFTLSVKLAFGKFGVLSCYSDRDCADGYFCNEKSCRKCLKCNLLFRKGNSCAIDFSDCEDCLPGYEEVLTTDFSTAVKPCKKKLNIKICVNSDECPPDNYCDSDFCVKCFDCSLVNRVQPFGKCARGLDECGACMTGFNEVAVTTKVNSKPCEMDMFATLERTDSHKNSNSNIAPVFFLTVLIVAAIVTLMLKYFKDRNLTKTTHENSIRPSAPPLCILDVPQCTKKQEELPNLTRNSKKQEIMDAPQYIKKQEEFESPVNFVEEKKQLAKVFKQPDALYYFYTEEELCEMSNHSLENNEESRFCTWTAATSALPDDKSFSASILTHIYSDINDSSVNLSIPQPSENTTSNIPLDVLDGAQTTGNSVQEVTDNLYAIQKRDERET